MLALRWHFKIKENNLVSVSFSITALTHTRTRTHTRTHAHIFEQDMKFNLTDKLRKEENGKNTYKWMTKFINKYNL